MKRAFLSVFFAISSLSLAYGHIQPSIAEYVQTSDTVCIVKVVSVEKTSVTFEVEEIIKGNPPKTLKLNPMFETFPLNSEWLLSSTRAKTDSVGWALKGDFGWVDAPIMRVNGKPVLVGNFSHVLPEVAKDPSKGMSLEQLKKLANSPPTTDWKSIWLPLSH